MKSINKYSLIILLCTTIIFSCDDAKKASRLNVICLIDYSGSLKEDVLVNYAKIISNDVYGNLKSKDKIVLLPIDEGAKIEAVKLFYDDLSTHKEFSKQSDGLSHKQDSLKARVLRYVKTNMNTLNKLVIEQKEIRKKYTNKTDIVSAIEQASLLLEKNTDISKYNTTNVIIFFSDMLHESDKFNLRKINTSNKKVFDDLIVQLQSENNIPNLKNCIIYVNGRTGANNKVVENTQYFWEQYFKNSNADLKAYDFDCSNNIIQCLQQRQ